MILERLKDVPEEKRSARFVCAVAAAFPDGQTKVIRGTMEGIIGYEIKERMDLDMIRSSIYHNMGSIVPN